MIYVLRGCVRSFVLLHRLKYCVYAFARVQCIRQVAREVIALVDEALSSGVLNAARARLALVAHICAYAWRFDTVRQKDDSFIGLSGGTQIGSQK